MAQVGFAYVDGDVSPHHDEAQLYAHWESAVAEIIRNGVIGGPRTAGIWFGRSDDHAIVMVVHGSRQVLVEPFSPYVGSDGKLEIKWRWDEESTLIDLEGAEERLIELIRRASTDLPVDVETDDKGRNDRPPGTACL